MRHNVLDDLCDRIDAGVFSSDMLFDNELRAMLRFYMSRWGKAIEEHQSYETEGVTPFDEP